MANDRPPNHRKIEPQNSCLTCEHLFRKPFCISWCCSKYDGIETDLNYVCDTYKFKYLLEIARRGNGK